MSTLTQSPEALFWFGLCFKIVLTASIVVAASVVVQRSGPFIGALIVGLPTAAGAAYIILAIEHPPAFIAQSAVGSMVANAVTVVFMLTYASLARTRGLVVSVLVAMLVWFAGVYLSSHVSWTLPLAIVANLLVFPVTIALSWRLRHGEMTAGKARPRRQEIALRAAIVAVFVAAVTTASHQIGSFASGIFAVFPIAMTSFIVILHSRVSGSAASRTMAHAQIPMLGLVAAFAVLHLTAVPLGIVASYLLHLAVCLGWNALLWLAQRRGLL